MAPGPLCFHIFLFLRLRRRGAQALPPGLYFPRQPARRVHHLYELDSVIRVRLPFFPSLLSTAADKFAISFSSSKYPRMSNLPAFTSSDLSRIKRESLLSSSDKLSTSISIGEFGIQEKVSPYSPTDSTASSSLDSLDRFARRSSSFNPHHVITPLEPSLDITTVSRYSPEAPPPPPRRASIETV